MQQPTDEQRLARLETVNHALLKRIDDFREEYRAGQQRLEVQVHALQLGQQNLETMLKQILNLLTKP